MRLTHLFRSILFAIVFYIGSVFFVLLALIGLIGSQSLLQNCAHGWSRYHAVCARIFLNVRVRIDGRITQEPVVFAIKHESAFETIEVLRQFSTPAVVAKKELARIPFWGTVATHYGMIYVDRNGGARALRDMLKSVRSYIAQGRPIIIFAEGRTVSRGERPPLASGFAGLYKIAGLPVVPIALDSGLVSPKHSFIKTPGTITFKIGEQIPAGLPRAEVEARVHEAINALNSPA